MFLKLTEKFGKPICVALYASLGALAAKKTITVFPFPKD